MIIVIHLLEHLGVPSGAAIAIVIAARKSLRAGSRGPGRAATATATANRALPHDYRRADSPGCGTSGHRRVGPRMGQSRRWDN